MPRSFQHHASIAHQLDQSWLLLVAFGWLVGWLVGCWLVGWLFGCLVCLGCFFSWLVGLSWLIGGWLVDSSVGWLVCLGLLVCLRWLILQLIGLLILQLIGLLIVQLIDVRNRNSVRPTSLNAAQLACISIMSASIRSHQLDCGLGCYVFLTCWLDNQQCW